VPKIRKRVDHHWHFDDNRCILGRRICDRRGWSWPIRRRSCAVQRRGGGICVDGGGGRLCSGSYLLVLRVFEFFV